ncbi:hypothetical protein DL93DRAFT_2092164 [Clavulina sp. PMI_390]|nr:hypothetical protein DL93DRAFT_2092276 [Clavulina sp. PMI_390]KAF8289110.1 hypothetical protein DL93DRAFT_2092164 [Clavulina sp. PMI_390]
MITLNVWVRSRRVPYPLSFYFISIAGLGRARLLTFHSSSIPSTQISLGIHLRFVRACLHDVAPVP